MDTTRVERSGAMSREEMRLFVQKQLEEIDKYKWCLGERLGHDPLRDRTYDQIACEWILLHGAEFRRAWGGRIGQSSVRPAGAQASALGAAVP